MIGCPICGYSKNQVDEHIDTYHSTYDMARMLDALIEELTERGGGTLARVQAAQKQNLTNLKKRLKNARRDL